MSEEKNALVEYDVNGEQVKLSPGIVKQYLVSGNGKVTDQEIVMFMQLARYQHLNPFLNEAYLVKFGSSPASIIVSKEAFMKRANANPHYQGVQAGIMVARGDDIVQLNGAVKLPSDKLIGGWATVKRDDREDTHVEIALEEFSKGQSTWKSMPQNMIRKSAIVNALREAFPEQLGDMYTEDDKNPNDTSRVTVQGQESQPKSLNDLIADDSEPTQESQPVETPVEPDKKEEVTHDAEPASETQQDILDGFNEAEAAANANS
ncbi:phage recombination protein Bet [Secundilactobacillus kimchicus]|uniref:phage recombination protein Bet n=1 Tax=Secundilactobacillus kimchicus TaxID=528209 RepID=UPI0024A8B741|nr:phage recombination protein Bet [Secundilactobacillus kimchicus]